MILVDTSVWVEHFRSGVGELPELLEESQVLIHPFVIGELACGNLRNRSRILADLAALPSLQPTRHVEVLRLVDRQRLWAKGIGWIDAHLLAAAAIGECRLWTLDRALERAAKSLNVLR